MRILHGEPCLECAGCSQSHACMTERADERLSMAWAISSSMDWLTNLFEVMDITGTDANCSHSHSHMSPGNLCRHFMRLKPQVICLQASTMRVSSTVTRTVLVLWWYFRISHRRTGQTCGLNFSRAQAQCPMDSVLANACMPIDGTDAIKGLKAPLAQLGPHLI